jgi:hypothetical protein
MNLSIKKVSLEDQQLICEFISEAIDSGAYSKLGVVNTPKSVDNIFILEIRPLLINQDPAFVAYDGDEPAGFSCASTSLNSCYDLESKIAIGQLTVIKKQYQNTNCLKTLHKKIISTCKSIDVKYILTDRLEKQTDYVYYNTLSRCVSIKI